MLTLFLLSVSAISCTFVRNLGGERVSEKTRQLNESVPAGLEFAEPDDGINDSSAVKIILLEPGQIMIGNAAAQPLDAASLGKRLKELFSARSRNDPAVYLAAAEDLPASEISAVLDELRINNFDKVMLMTSSRGRIEDQSLFRGEIPAPDRVLRVTLQNKTESGEKPNPLTLIVRAGDDGTPILNSEPKEDLRSLRVMLSEIFRDREMNGVFREGTNEVSKTVWVAIRKGGSAQRYGDLVSLIDAVKGSGADPIVLGEEGSFDRVPEMSELRKIPHVTPMKDPPKIISGGVLNGKATSLPKPDYPPAARAVRAAGAVSIQVTVDTDGKVISASAVSGHPLLRAAATSAARSAEFSPTLLSGKPVQVSGVIVYNFVP